MLRVRPAGPTDRAWVERFLEANFSTVVARRGELVRPTDHPMLLAERDGAPAALLTYVVDGEACEVLTLHALERRTGVGTALIEAVADVARAAGCRRLWLLTTNDNVEALRFYQRRGFRLAVLRPGAVDEARRTLKPSIPEVGEFGIPIRDEIELERSLET